MCHRATGFGDVVSTEKKPKVGYGKKEAKLGRKMGHIVEFTKFNN